MATTRTFSTMLNEYLPNKLLREELIKMDYVLSKVKKDNNWLGGDIIVPFVGNTASSVNFGQLEDASTISEMTPVRGSISGYKEVWGSMKFNHTDIMQHGKLSEQNLINAISDTVSDFLPYVKEVVSIQLTAGPHFASVTADTDLANGKVTVDRVERFRIGQKVALDDDDSPLHPALYVTAIDLDNSYVTVSASRGGAAYDLTADYGGGGTGYTLAQNSKFYIPGVSGTSTNFTSLKQVLLSSANGGASSLYGQTKTAYPYLQAINISGATITASNIMEKIFDAWTDVRKKARGNADDIMMSYKNFGSCMKVLELQKGAFKVGENSTKANAYGWSEIVVTQVATNKRLTLVGIQEMDDDVIFFMDWSGATFRSNGLFQKRKNPENGNEFFEVRATTGYSYIVDLCCFGELEVRNPGKCGALHSISY